MWPARPQPIMGGFWNRMSFNKMTQNLFSFLESPPLPDMCVAMPDYFHLPLQQQALRHLLAPERALQIFEHELWVEQTLLAYIMGQRAEAQLGAPRFLPPALLAALNKPEGAEETLPFTRFFAMLCRRMRPYDRSADGRTRESRRRFYLDFLVVQNIKLRLPSALVPDYIWHHLNEPAYPALSDAPALSFALAHLWRKLFNQLPFAPHDAVARKNFFNHAMQAITQYGLDPRLMPSATFPAAPAQADVLVPPTPRAPTNPNTINLLLWDNPQNVLSSLAPHVEMALKAAGISYAVHRLPAPQAAGVYEGATNLLFIHPDCLADGMLAHGLSVLEGRRNIIYAFWETDKLPDFVRLALPLVDEIWVPCEAQKNLFSQYTHAPVHVVPLPINLAAPAPHLTRAQLGLSETAFQFLSVMDGADSFARKNISGALDAFQHAFAQNENVQFVIKTRGFNRNLLGREEGAWARLKRRMADDARIIHLHEDFSASEQAALYKQADCFVSLHRASPFGASALEALAGGTPLIASASGRVHEIAPKGSFHAIPVQISSVVFDVTPTLDREVGHHWLDPDVAEAARAMRDVCANKAGAQNMAQKAASIATQLSVAACGAVMKERLS